MIVGDALRRTGIQAVLTGGACAHVHSKGAYSSLDADFVLAGEWTVESVDGVLGALGFRRDRDRYVHPDLDFFVEFPAGPLGIGEDYRVKPVWTRRGSDECVRGASARGMRARTRSSSLN